ncbi:MAG: hypothetical protein ABIP75_18400 [Pyrinomonadaceae bacterium]
MIENYAIGGAVAAIYYLEPFETSDLDVFVQISAHANGLALLAPIYEFLAASGYEPKGEFIFIEGMPVQFFPVFNPLTDDAVDQALNIRFGSTSTRVMTAEHLVAIMVDTGRPNDLLRINWFLESDKVDEEKLSEILSRHDLNDKWETNRRRFES